jgi:hypothetical protein
MAAPSQTLPERLMLHATTIARHELKSISVDFYITALCRVTFFSAVSSGQPRSPGFRARCESSYSGPVPNFVFRWSPRRSARATIVRVGLACPPVGKTEQPATNRLAVP